MSVAKIELIIHDARNPPARRSEAEPHWVSVADALSRQSHRKGRGGRSASVFHRVDDMLGVISG